MSSDEAPHAPSAENEVPVASAHPEAPALGRGHWYKLELDTLGARLPPECACCGAPVSAHAVVRRGRDAAEILVGYCGDCHEHIGKDGTRTLGVALASLLLALALGVALPLSWPAPLAKVTLAVLAASLFPLGLAWALRPRARPGHAAWGAAVKFAGTSLCCARREYAERVARSNPSARGLERASQPWFSPWMLAGPLIALSLTPFAYELCYPTLRVLNLTGERFELWIDGRFAASVDPTSVESPLAGRELEVLAGARLFEVFDPSGAVVAREQVRVLSGKYHLFAPASDAYCFWVETQSYGRDAGDTVRRPLPREAYFWVLPDGIDAFFAPPAEPGALAETLSGGSVSVLRQAPCAEAPEEVRPL